jgi:hypothetical protein
MAGVVASAIAPHTPRMANAEAGFVVMAGGATAAVALEPDTAIRLDVEAPGSTGFTVTA